MPKQDERVRYNILLTNSDPRKFKSLRGLALLGNETTGRMSFCQKFLPRIVRITPLGIGVFRCTNTNGMEWLIINVEKF